MTIRQRFSLVLFGDKEDGTWWRICVHIFLALCWAWPLSTVVDFVINRQPPVTYLEAYAPNPNVEPGGQVEVRFDVDRRRICPVINVSRVIEDGTGLQHVVLGYTKAADTRPGREVYDRLITVPETVPPGRASYHIRIAYGCNWLHYLGWPIVVDSPDIPLNVRARAGR